MTTMKNWKMWMTLCLFAAAIGSKGIPTLIQHEDEPQCECGMDEDGSCLPCPEGEGDE